MSDYRYDATELPVDAPSWRPVDRALVRWTLAHGGGALVARLAGWALWAESQGHVALLLADDDHPGLPWPRLEAEAIAALRADPLVGDGSARTPFVLDDAERFYLWRHHDDERALAAALRARLDAPRAAFDAAAADAAVATLFDGDDARADGQRAAVRAALGRALFVLTGGPGSGKTRTVLRLAAASARIADRPLRIALAAPTGKAAQRLEQSWNAGLAALAPLTADPSWSPVIDGLASARAQTLHRLLGWSPRRGDFAERTLPFELVVIDEASMLDPPMLRAVLAACGRDTTLVLVGDAEQLASVAAGAVLAGIVSGVRRCAPHSHGELRSDFRASPELSITVDAIRRGSIVALDDAIAAAPDSAHWRLVDSTAALPALAARCAARWNELLGAVRSQRHDAVSAAAALASLGRFQLLTALREGPFGAPALAMRIEQSLRQRWGVAADAAWYPGRAVLVTRNDTATGLANGDVGLCLFDNDGRLAVWFLGGAVASALAAAEVGLSDEQDRDRVTLPDSANPPWGIARSAMPGSLPPIESAFALTVHKAQGSEYEEVVVLLPPAPEQPILTHSLLYTAASRARHRLEIAASRASLEAALAARAERSSGLAERL